MLARSGVYVPHALTSCPTSLKISPKKISPRKICTRKSPSIMSSTLTSNPIPLLTDSMLADSYFNGQPGFPSIRQTSTASWPSVLDGSNIPAVPRPGLNKIYFNKKILKESVQRYNANTLQNETAQVWEIPFSVHVEIPVGDLIQRIQHVMTARGTYKHWDINMNTFLITASQVTSERDTIR